MAFNYSPKIVTDGLVLALDAANNKSYPGSGTTWTDISRGGNNGTLINGPTFNSANGGEIVFDGTDDYIDCGNPTSLNFGIGSFTVSCFFKPLYSQIGGIFPAIIDKSIGDFTSPGAGVTGWLLYYRIDLARWMFGLGDSTNTTNSLTFPATVSNDGIYKNLTVTVSSTTITGYYNGVNIGSITRTLTGSVSTSVNLNIGRWRFPSRELNASISQAQLYNRELSASEVLQNYNSTKTRFGL